MARIRTIKPEFWTDIKITKLSIPTRLFFIGMWNFADDNGVLIDDPEQLGLWIFPRDDLDFEALVGELEEKGLIKRYKVGDKKYIYIRNFRKHQKIDRPRQTTLPLPPEIAEANQLPSDEINGNQMKSTEINRNQLKSDEITLGKEGKGKDSNNTHTIIRREGKGNGKGTTTFLTVSEILKDKSLKEDDKKLLSALMIKWQALRLRYSQGKIEEAELLLTNEDLEAVKNMFDTWRKEGITLEEFIRKANKQDFLWGYGPKGWIASFAWMIRNWQKVWNEEFVNRR